MKFLMALTVILFLINPVLAADAPSQLPERSLIAKIWDFIDGGGWAGLCDRTFGEGSGVKWRHEWKDATPTSWASYDACQPVKKEPK